MTLPTKLVAKQLMFDKAVGWSLQLMYNDTWLGTISVLFSIYMSNVGNVFLENLELKENALVCPQ